MRTGRTKGRILGIRPTEVALAVATLAAIVGMHRLFEDASFLPPLLLQAGMAHVVVGLLRRRGVGLAPAAVVAAVAAVLTLTWTHYAASTTALLPTSTTVRLTDDDLRAAWQVFQEVRAPAPVETGFLVAAGAAIWIVVYVADWAALRARATFEALLPTATLFLFAAALGAPGGRVASAVLYATAALAFVLVQRTFSREESWSWTASQQLRTRWSLLGPGAVLIGVAVGAAALAGPNLPGAQADPVVAWRDLGDDDDTRVVVSPLVNIQSQLVEQSGVELFQVRSPEPTYYRLTALDQFDGNIWRSTFDTKSADGELPQSLPNTARFQKTVEQEFEIIRLGNEWVPAASEPVAIDAEGFDVVWDERSSSLIVGEAVPTSDGFEYTVTSEVPNWTPEELVNASERIPAEIRERYVELPDDAVLDPSGDIRALAEQVTAGATSRYEKALALQDFFRDENEFADDGIEFTYSPSVPAGESKDSMREFLTRTHTGFCQQFAGTYAAMARMLGMPTRVAVGFTPGLQDEEDRNLYQVLGTHAHAWPEVYFDGLGWVQFEPTPGRGPTGGEDYLGVPPEQAQIGGDGTASEPLPGDTEDRDSDAPSTAPQDRPRPQQPAPDPGLGEAGGSEGAAAGDNDGSPVSRAINAIGRVLGIGVAGYLVLVPAALLGQRALRRRQASGTAERVCLAWHDATRRAAAAHISLPPWLTVSETADHLASTLPEAGDAVRTLADSMERVVYAEVTPTVDEAERAVWASSRIVAESRRTQTLLRRIGAYVDVRELWRDHRRLQPQATPEPGEGERDLAVAASR